MKNLFGTALLVLTIAACASQPPPTPPPPPAAPVAKATTPEDMAEEGNRLFGKRDFQGALASYDRALAIKPDDDIIVFNRAVTLHRLGRKDEARKIYEALLGKNENDTQAALNLGAILKEEGKIDDAMALYKKVLKRDEYNPDVLNNLSVLQRKKNDYKAAVASIRKLLMRDKNNVDAYKNLALVHYDQKQLKLAQTILENALKMAIQQKKEDPDIYVNLGMVFLASKDNGKAMAAFKKAIAIDPMHVVANYNIGALALEHRDYKLAAKAYEVAAKAWPERYDVHASLGFAYQGLEQHDRAAEELLLAKKIMLEQAVVKTDPTEEENLTRQAVNVLQNAGKVKQALEMLTNYLLEKGISCTPEQVEGVCGQKAGLEATIQLESQQQAPEEKKEAKDADASKIFTDQPVEGEPAPEDTPAEGAPPPAAGETPPPPEGGGQ